MWYRRMCKGCREDDFFFFFFVAKYFFICCGLTKKSHRVVIKIHVSVSGGTVRWRFYTCRTLLHSSSYPPCFQVCLLLVKPHTGCLLRRCTRTLVGTASQRHRRDLYYNTAPETWPLVPLPTPTGAPARRRSTDVQYRTLQ